MMTPTMPTMGSRAWRRLGMFVLAFLLTAASSSQAGANEISFYGQGSGHGVGLSQYGAKAMALGGSTYRQILHRYYSGASVITLRSADGGTFLEREQSPLWVNLLQRQSSTSFEIEEGSADICFDGAGGCIGRASQQESWIFSYIGQGHCAFSLRQVGGVLTQVGQPGPCNASVRPLSEETTFRVPRKARSYRGTLRLRSPNSDGTFHLVLQTDLESYLRGVSEVPESWPIEAIKAQVVATRSMAAWTLLDRGSEQLFSDARQSDCYCNMSDGASDQVFRGYTGESEHPNWVSAVQDSAAEVISYAGDVAYGLYFHSSAGATENYSDVFSEGTFPYLVSVNDSPAISDFADNPLRQWGYLVAANSISTLFSFSWVNDVQVIANNPTGTVRSVAISGIRSGRPVVDEVGGVDFQTALGLPSAVYEVVVDARFTDVPSGHLFAGEVTGLLELGITQGCTPTTFCPEAPVTRGEMAAFLVRTLDLEPVDGFVDPFYDDDGSSFEADIEILRGHGITNGCSAAEFCPTETVTRGEMAAFLVRAFDLSISPGDSFSDDDDSVFETEIEALAASGVTSGCTQGRFCPSRPVTRGEMAAFLVRALALT